MFRLNSVTPPSWNSRASARISGVIVVPGRLPIRSWPISRRKEEGTKKIKPRRARRTRSGLICFVVIETSAPTRIDLAGGTIDIWPLYLFHAGAQTLNAAISLRAHAQIEERRDGGIVLRSIDTEREVRAGHWSELSADSDLPLLALLARHYRL